MAERWWHGLSTWTILCAVLMSAICENAWGKLPTMRRAAVSPAAPRRCTTRPAAGQASCVGTPSDQHIGIGRPKAAGEESAFSATRRSFRRTDFRSTTSAWRAPARTRFSSLSSATIRATSRFIPNSTAIFRKYKRHFWRCGGKNDPFFLPVGAEAFKRDIPNADVRFFDTGHFALETHTDEIAAAIREFLDHGPSELRNAA
jgi:pimeloyl-ACP methyl ester carboxylesterase